MAPEHNKQLVRLNANENFYGCPPGVLEAIRENIHIVSCYPAYPSKLEKKLAGRFGVSELNIVLGGGSVRVIEGIIKTFVAHDEEIMFFERSFVAYKEIAIAFKRKYIMINQENFTNRIENIFPLISPKTRVILIDNPNNPTGTIIGHSDLETLLAGIPENILVIIDEAYNEYVTDKTFPDSLLLQKKFPNLVIVRSFSKIYGLAGLRIGYAIADEIIASQLKHTRIPYFLNIFAEEAALVALEDDGFIQKSVQANSIESKFLTNNIRSLGYTVPVTHANFVFICFESEEEKEIMFKALYDSGLLVCNLKVFGIGKSLRAGVANNEINSKIVGVFASNKVLFNGTKKVIL
jgi:histidinol-phosphate aminotransferase